MFTQFFANYLLNKKIINKEQLMEVLNDSDTKRIKLGTLSIYEGLLTASDVDRIHILQTHIDKKFGQIAVEEGYLTIEQVDYLCEKQQPDYLLFGQKLIDKKYITTQQFEDLLNKYQSEFEIDNMEYEEELKDKVIVLVKNLYNVDTIENSDRNIEYMVLLFNNLIRFIGNDFTPLSADVMPEYATKCCTTQAIIGKNKILTGIDMDIPTAISFASRYMGKELYEYNEYVAASIEDFLNLHNGLFSVNMSNEYDLELDLEPLEQQNNSIISTGSNIVYFPIIFSFGVINIVLNYNSFE